jgi:hypothetical protein
MKILTAVTLAVLIASPAKAPAAAFPMGSEVLPHAGGALQSARWEVDPPDTGSVIIECGPGPHRRVSTRDSCPPQSRRARHGDERVQGLSAGRCEINPDAGASREANG